MRPSDKEIEDTVETFLKLVLGQRSVQPGQLHLHRCGVCRAEWEHRAPIEVVSEEAYDKFHTCPNGHLHEDNFMAGPPREEKRAA